MSPNLNDAGRKALILRRNAESKLRSGSAPLAGGVPLDMEALTLLYTMASDPKRSSDARRLLQELQVHQVELDMQREELENSERELSRELALYKALFDLTPAVSLVTTVDGRITEANAAAATLVNIEHGELAGRTLRDFVKPESHAAWTELLGKLKVGEHEASCDVVIDRGEQEVSMRLSARFLIERGDVLLFGSVS